MSQKRKLAAIMFTDIVGYTAMMQEDETQAVAMRNRHRQVFEKHHETFKGNILQYYGDGTLSIFDSAIDATKCALAIQVDLQQEPKVPLRIGLHTGDIIYSEEEAIGDGVNIASRIESLAVPGSIMLSETVRNYIKNQNEFAFQPMGKFSFKNVAKPMDVYALNAGNIVIPSPSELQGKFISHQAPTPQTIEKNFFQKMPIWAKYLGGFALFLALAPIIYFPLYNSLTSSASTQPNPLVSVEEVKKFYVAPFVQKGGDSTHNWLGVGIPYALEMDWDQDPYIFNIYPDEAKDKPLNTQLQETITSHCPKLLKGTYEVTDEGYNIQVLMYEAKSGQKIHDTTYTGKELFSLLDEISLSTKRFLQIPESHLAKVQDLPVSQILTQSLPAYKLFSSAISDRSTGVNFFPFVKLQDALKEDSTFAWAAYTISNYHHFFQRSTIAAKQNIRQAMRHRKRLPDIFEIEIRQLQYKIDGEPEKALELGETLANLNPGKSSFRIGLIADYFTNDQCDKALENLEALRQSRALEDDSYQFVNLEIACLIRNQELDKALDLSQRHLKDNPENKTAKSLLGVVYLNRKEWDKAKSLFEQMAILNPEAKNFERYLKHIEFMEDSVFDNQIYDNLVGEYWIENYANFKFNLFKEGEALFVKVKNQPSGRLYPMSSMNYFTDYNFSLKFVKDSLGNVSRFKAAEGFGGFYDVLKIPRSLQDGLVEFSAGNIEKAKTLLAQTLETHPNYTIAKNLIKHIQFSEQNSYPDQVASYNDYLGKYKGSRVTLDISLKDGLLYTKSNAGNTISDPIGMYEIEPGVFMNLVGLNKVFRFARKKGRITGFEVYADGELQNTLEKVE